MCDGRTAAKKRRADTRVSMLGPVSCNNSAHGSIGAPGVRGIGRLEGNESSDDVRCKTAGGGTVGKHSLAH